MADDDLSEVLYESVFVVAKKLGVTQMVSSDMARMVDDTVRKRCGGRRMYVPAVGVEARDAELFGDYLSGMKPCDLMKKYRLSKSGLYDRLKKLRQ